MKHNISITKQNLRKYISSAHPNKTNSNKNKKKDLE